MQEFIYAAKQLLPFVSVELLYSENELCLLNFSSVSGLSTPRCAVPDCLLMNPTPWVLLNNQGHHFNVNPLPPHRWGTPAWQETCWK